MKYDPQRHRRRSIRLKGYDYSQPGAYFVTVCTHHLACLFGDVVDGEMELSDVGQIVQACWDDLSNHYQHVRLDAFVIMPNHVHGIIVLMDYDNIDNVGAGFKPAPTETPAPVKRHGLPEIVRAFKTFSSRHINQWRGTPGTPVWQRNYYEHIIRDSNEFNHIRQYTTYNAARWLEDENHPARIGRQRRSISS